MWETSPGRPFAHVSLLERGRLFSFKPKPSSVLGHDTPDDFRVRAIPKDITVLADSFKSSGVAGMIPRKSEVSKCLNLQRFAADGDSSR